MAEETIESLEKRIREAQDRLSEAEKIERIARNDATECRNRLAALQLAFNKAVDAFRKGWPAS